MLRKALILGMVFIFGLSLLAVSMITCFTYDAEADAAQPDLGHGHWNCKLIDEEGRTINQKTRHWKLGDPWICTWEWMTVDD